MADLPDDGDEPSFASANTVRTDPALLERTIPVSSGSGPGSLLGRRYLILAELGRGGEGAVYKVRDRHADEVVALKVLDNVREGSEELARLRRELANARRITHPGIVRLHDLVEVDDRWALSMQLVEGSSLENRLTQGPPFGAEELVALARRLAEALAAAHAAGVTHRDLKPANVLLHPDGRPVISDFGISRSHAARERRLSSGAGPAEQVLLTQVGAIVGTPLYMAPEQLLGEPATPAVDVYAFGLIVYEAATGTVPLAADSLPALQLARTNETAPSIAAARPDLPVPFAQVIDRCLARDPAQRIADGAQLVAALEHRVEPKPRELSPASVARLTAPRRHALLGWVLGAVAVTATLSVIVTRARSPSAPASASASATPSAPAFRFAPREHRRLTFGDGCEEFPSFFPDGRRLVFDGTVGDRSHLYLLDLDTGEQQQLTTSSGWDFAASASPVADELVFLRYGEGKQATYRLDLKTRAIQWVADGGMRPVYTAGGKEIWAGVRVKPVRIDLASGRTLETLEIPSGRSPWALLPLPDERLLVSFPPQTEGDTGGLSFVSGAPGARTWSELTAESVEEALTLSPDRSHVIAGRILPTRTELAALPLAGGPPIDLSASSISPGKGIVFSPNGAQVVWSTCRDLNSFELLESDGREPTAGQGDFDGAAMADGRLVVLSTRDGRARPWIIDPTGAEAPRPLSIEANPVHVDVSPDGTKLVFATRSGLVVVEGDGPPRSLTKEPRDVTPVFRGSEEIVFAREDEAGSHLLSVRLDDGEVKALGVDGAFPTPIPGSADLVYVATVDGMRQPFLWSAQSRSVRPFSPQLPPGRYHRPDVSADGRLLAIPHEATEVLIADVRTGRPIRTLAKGGDQLERPVFDASGKLYVARVRWTGDLWTAEVGESQARDGAGAP